MGVKKWDDRVNLITQHIEKLSLDNCYHTPSKKKDCACLSFFQGDEVAQKCIALYILYWAKKSPMEQKMVLIEKIKSVLTYELMTGTSILYCHKKKEGGPKLFFIVPFIAPTTS